MVVGGHTAMEKALPKIKEAIEDKDIEITDALWYGGDATYDHVDMLAASDAVKSADMIWAVGGGKATDTGKTLADVTGKPILLSRRLHPTVRHVQVFQLCIKMTEVS